MLESCRDGSVEEPRCSPDAAPRQPPYPVFCADFIDLLLRLRHGETPLSPDSGLQPSLCIKRLTRGVPLEWGLIPQISKAGKE